MRYLLAVPLVALTVTAEPAIAQILGPMSEAEKQLVQGNNQFACDLYTKLASGDGNLFFSPYSISTALSMTYAGARGTTAREMSRTLHLGENPHPAFAALIQRTSGAEQKRSYQLGVANALWGQTGYGFLPPFLQLVQQSYGAGLKEVNFQTNPEESRLAINRWVEDQTRNKIKNLLNPGLITTETRLVLTNAIYFKAGWMETFSKEATKKEDFTTASGNKVPTPMMRQSGKFTYFENESFKLLNLPYERHDLSFVAILPKRVDGLGDVERSLTEEKLRGWLAAGGRYQVDVKLPKYKLSSEFKLKPELSGMGMATAFSDQADFSGMSSRDKLRISEVVHKAFIDVDEKGTEAAAATAVIMMETSAVLPGQLQKATFHATHPFLFLIRDNRTGSILFMGRMKQP